LIGRADQQTCQVSGYSTPYLIVLQLRIQQVGSTVGILGKIKTKIASGEGAAAADLDVDGMLPLVRYNELGAEEMKERLERINIEETIKINPV
jgi:hypothetical protein